jgi:hypothetical protein
MIEAIVHALNKVTFIVGDSLLSFFFVVVVVVIVVHPSNICLSDQGSMHV